MINTVAVICVVMCDLRCDVDCLVVGPGNVDTELLEASTPLLTRRYVYSLNEALLLIYDGAGHIGRHCSLWQEELTFIHSY